MLYQSKDTNVIEKVLKYNKEWREFIERKRKISTQPKKPIHYDPEGEMGE